VNRRLDRLQAYPFEKLDALLRGLSPPAALAPIPLTIGEPKHAPPDFVLATLRDHLARVDAYPATAGLPEFRRACAEWLTRRFALGAQAIDAATMVLPVNGTREALFAFAQAVIDPDRSSAGAPCVVMPNPCYQIYEGAALLAGAEPWYLPTTAASRFLPELDEVSAEVWERCQLLYLCSPGNPTGAVMSRAYLQQALALAERHDFVIAADECYADLYFDDAAPPCSLLEAALARGTGSVQRCVVFHSLSKRSSLPGLRSGFVAGDAELLQRFLLYRTYHGSAMSVPTQLASIAAWNDDAHATANRALYREKFARVLPLLEPVLDVSRPDGGFYLWAAVPGDDRDFARRLFAQTAVTVLPGSLLGRDSPTGGNPGRGRIRISLVASVERCVEAAIRIRAFMEGSTSR
jgi:N-succinyldiaminopimelate aminotransferase